MRLIIWTDFIGTDFIGTDLIWSDLIGTDLIGDIKHFSLFRQKSADMAQHAFCRLLIFFQKNSFRNDIWMAHSLDLGRTILWVCYGSKLFVKFISRRANMQHRKRSSKCRLQISPLLITDRFFLSMHNSVDPDKHGAILSKRALLV